MPLEREEVARRRREADAAVGRPPRRLERASSRLATLESGAGGVDDELERARKEDATAREALSERPQRGRAWTSAKKRSPRRSPRC